jgi:uncharacterized small protein (DUF1192 family)
MIALEVRSAEILQDEKDEPVGNAEIMRFLELEERLRTLNSEIQRFRPAK